MIVVPLLGGFDSNFCYVIIDDTTKKAVVIDPFDAGLVQSTLQEHNATLTNILNTHSHGDHTSGNKELHTVTRAPILPFTSNDPLQVGDTVIEFIQTPGHTPDGRCMLIDKKALFTGDTLFVGSVGFVTSKEDAQYLFKSLHALMTLPDDTLVFPGHDYGIAPSSTIGDEKKSNPYLLHARTEEAFLKAMGKG